MTQLAIPGGEVAYIAPLHGIITSVFALASVYAGIDVDNRLGMIFQVPITGDLEEVSWNNSLVAAGTNTKRISFQDLDASGFPDGGVDQFRIITPASGVWASSGIISSDGTDTGTLRHVTQGDWIAIVWDFTAYTSGTWGITGTNFTRICEEPYCASTNSVGTWAKLSSNSAPVFTLKYHTIGYVPIHGGIVPGFGAATLNTINSTTSPDEIALRFKVQHDRLSICGAALFIDADGDYEVILYDGDSRVLASRFVDKDYTAAGTIPGYDHVMMDRYGGDIELRANVEYRLAVRPSTSTSLSIQSGNVNSNGDLAFWEGGIECYYSSRTDGGAWTDVTTRRPLFGLLLRTMDDGVLDTSGDSGGPFSMVDAGPFYFPDQVHIPQAAGGPVFANVNTLNDSDDKAGFVIRVPKTGTLHSFEFRIGTVTTFPGNGLRLSFQDIGAADGFPDGSVDQYRVITVSPGSSSWAVPPGALTSDGTDSGTKRSVTAGDLLGLVVDFNPAYTTGNITVSGVQSDSAAPGFPYSLFWETAWSQAGLTGFMPIIALKYNDGTYEFIPFCAPWLTLTSHSFNNGSTPDERALYFSFPFDCKVIGARILVDLDGDADILLYDSDGTTALATVAHDKDIRMATQSGYLEVTFPSEITLARNTFYRLAVRPSSATSLAVYSFDVANTTLMGILSGGQDVNYSERTDAGSWSNTATKRLFASLIISEIPETAEESSPPTVIPTPIMHRIFEGM